MNTPSSISVINNTSNNLFRVSGYNLTLTTFSANALKAYYYLVSNTSAPTTASIYPYLDTNEVMFLAASTANERQISFQPLNASYPWQVETLSQLEDSERAERNIDELFSNSRDEYFEDGMESNFSNRLLSLVIRLGNKAVNEVRVMIDRNQYGPKLSAQAVMCLGRLRDDETYAWRFNLIVHNLESLFVEIRDAAAISLQTLAGIDAIPHIKKAIERESCQELRAYMQESIKELENSDVVLSKKDK